MSIDVPRMAPVRSRALSCLLLILLSATPYLNTLKGSFVYDDSEMVLENRNVIGKTTLYQIFFDKQTMTFSGELYRPLRDISYRIDYLIGGKEPLVYHVSNVLFHALTTIAAYWFLTLLFKGGPVPLLAAAFFAVHPLHTESVAWVKGRDDILFTLFYLLSFGMYLKHESIGGWKRRLYFLASISFFILSLLSKELAVTLPLTIVLYQVIFQRVKPRMLIPFFAISAIYISLRTYVLAQVAQMEEYWGGSFFATMLTMTKGVAQYIRLTLFPINQCADYVFPVSTWIDSGVAMSLSALLIILVIIFVSGNRYVLFGGIFFLVSLLPVLNIVPIKAVIAERFLYLPLIGFCIVSASALYRIFPVERNLMIASVIIVSFFSLTVKRNTVWKDSYSLWTDTMRKMPNSSRAHNDVGTEYWRTGRIEEAVSEYKKALALSDNPDAHNNLGLVNAKMGRMDEAVSEYKKALSVKPDYLPARINLGAAYVKMGRMDDAISEYKAALELKPYYLPARTNLGLVYAEMGRMDDAILEYKEALTQQPNNPEAHYMLGLAYAKMGRTENAISEYKEALELKPDYPEAQSNLGAIYFTLGQTDDAIMEYKKALELKQNYPDIHNNLGIAYARIGRAEEAISEYKKALTLKPDYAEAHNNLGVIYDNSGLTKDAVAEYKKALELKQDYPDAHNNLGLAYARMGRMDDAIVEYKEAIRLYSDFANAYFDLGSAYVAKGFKDKAKWAFENVLRLNPNDTEARQALESLGEMKR